MESSANHKIHRGDTRLLISVPHAGLSLAAGLDQRMTEAAISLADTDWFVARLYECALALGASMIVAGHSRYVVDLNRPPDDAPLYNETGTGLITGLVPMTTFSGSALYIEGSEPDVAEQALRLKEYWHPYHQALRGELDRILRKHSHAVLLDAHSIRSELPLLFEGTLADLNLGSNNGRSAAPDLIQTAVNALKDSRFSLVLDGRFKGGYITRNYGVPARGVHAIQLEMAQSAYMFEEPPAWCEDRAAVMQSVLKRLTRKLIQWLPR